MRPKLLQWHWQDYADRHRDRGNLLVPIDGPVDFVTRFGAEQFVNFPRYVLSGQWFINVQV